MPTPMVDRKPCKSVTDMVPYFRRYGSSCHTFFPSHRSPEIRTTTKNHVLMMFSIRHITHRATESGIPRLHRVAGTCRYSSRLVRCRMLSSPQVDK